MFSKWKDFFYSRLSKSRNKHLIYILPTLDGLKVIMLNVVLLVMGLIYSNNYVLFFDFILFCLFLGSMFYTHFNLKGISLISSSISALHVNETASIKLIFETTSSQGHYFVNAPLHSSFLKLLENKTFTISPKNPNVIELRIEGTRRGVESLERLYIETQFPFNFFRCFTFLRLDLECFIYPERKNLMLQKISPVSSHEIGEFDDFGIREYRLGDSIKRIDWKKVAKNNRWYTREAYASSLPSLIIIVEEEVLRSSKEDSLKSICYELYRLHNEEVLYGLKIGNQLFIAPDNTKIHLTKCLNELSRYAY